ncbi:hypothetical protein QUF90_07285 [Desulfococcaceae bacterium HSG9]|nr:hypothetical protein [Desulfococcaceae bacterium HSG9]
MSNIFGNQHWPLIALAFFGFLAYIAWNRWQDRRQIEKRFGLDNVLAMSFGVYYYGNATDPGPPRRISGFFLLLPGCVYFCSRRAKLEIEIPFKCIDRVYHGSTLKDVDLHQSVVKIDFLNRQQHKDTAAFKMPYPPQWIQMIGNKIVASTEN